MTASSMAAVGGRQGWEAARIFVAEHLTEFRDVSDDPEQIRRLARDHGFGGGLFHKVKQELYKQAGINYEAEYRRRKVERDALLAQRELEVATAAVDSPVLVLTIASDADRMRFAITDRADNPVWFNTFHDRDEVPTGDHAEAAQAVAQKALWLAGKVRDHLSRDAIAVVVQHSVPITPPRLRWSAVSARAVPQFKKIPSMQNSARDWLQVDRFRQWQENRLDDILHGIAGPDTVHQLPSEVRYGPGN